MRKFWLAPNRQIDTSINMSINHPSKSPSVLAVSLIRAWGRAYEYALSLQCFSVLEIKFSSFQALTTRHIKGGPMS